METDCSTNAMKNTRPKTILRLFVYSFISIFFSKHEKDRSNASLALILYSSVAACSLCNEKHMLALTFDSPKANDENRTIAGIKLVRDKTHVEKCSNSPLDNTTNNIELQPPRVHYTT
jgi:hypothetical protein